MAELAPIPGPAKAAQLSAARAERMTACLDCGKPLVMDDPAKPPKPTRATRGGRLYLAYLCPDGHEREVLAQDVVRYLRTDRTGRGPMVLKALDDTMRLSMASLARLFESGQHDKIAGLAAVVAAMAKMNLQMGGVMVDRLEVEHSGAPLDSDEERQARIRERAKKMALDFLKANGLDVVGGKVVPVMDVRPERGA